MTCLRKRNFFFLWNKFCYSIIFSFFSTKKLFSYFSSAAKIVIFSRRLTKRKNELNLIANRDATTQLLCQYAKNTQTFNSTGVAGEFWNFFACFRGKTHFFVTLGKIITLLSLATAPKKNLCPKFILCGFQLFSFSSCKFHATKNSTLDFYIPPDCSRY